MDNCKNCRFFSSADSECRKNPPAIKLGDYENVGIWPTVSEDLFCGAFEEPKYKVVQ